MSIKPFAGRQSTGLDSFKVADHIGRLVVITVNGFDDIETKYGARFTVKADVTVCDGILAGKDYTNILIFSAGIYQDLKGSKPGDSIAARIVEISLRNGASTYALESPRTEDAALIAKAFPGLYEAPVQEELHEAGF